MSQPEILPDCRAREGRGAIETPHGWWEPVYCGNCGKDGGIVPSDMSFAYYACDDCAAKLGPAPGMMFIPDELFWKKVIGEQLEKYGRLLSPREILTVAREGIGALSKLLRTTPSGRIKEL